MSFWKKLNSKKLLQNAKDLTKLVENNVEAEILLDKIQGVERYYERVEAYENKYKILIHQIVNEFNYKYSSSNKLLKIEIQEIEDHYAALHSYEDKKTWIVVGNIHRTIREQVSLPASMIMSKEKAFDMFYEKLYKIILLEGMITLFTPQKQLICECQPNFYKEGEPIQTRILKVI